MLETIISFIDRIVQTMTPTLNNIVAGLIIIFIGFIIGKLVGGFLLKILRDVRVDETGKKVLKRNVTFAANVSSFVAYSIYVVSFILALDAIGIRTYVFWGLSIVFLVVIVFSLLMSLRDLLPNLSAGIRMRKDKKFSTGRSVSFLGVRGKIEKHTLLQTNIRRKNGDLFIFPNKLFKEKI